MLGCEHPGGPTAGRPGGLRWFGPGPCCLLPLVRPRDPLAGGVGSRDGCIEEAIGLAGPSRPLASATWTRRLFPDVVGPPDLLTLLIRGRAARAGRPGALAAVLAGPRARAGGLRPGTRSSCRRVGSRPVSGSSSATAKLPLLLQLCWCCRRSGASLLSTVEFAPTPPPVLLTGFWVGMDHSRPFDR